MKEEEFDTVINTNLYGVYHCLKHAAKQMLKQKSGRIINISSISGVIGNAGQINYCAAKAGVIGMTKSLARELGSRGITVNAVAPGFITTEMTDKLSEQIRQDLLEKIPLKRFGDAKEIAAAVAFLASEEAAYITGQTIQIDGGMGMKIKLSFVMPALFTKISNLLYSCKISSNILETASASATSA